MRRGSQQLRIRHGERGRSQKRRNTRFNTSCTTNHTKCIASNKQLAAVCNYDRASWSLADNHVLKGTFSDYWYVSHGLFQTCPPFARCPAILSLVDGGLLQAAQ